MRLMLPAEMLLPLPLDIDVLLRIVMLGVRQW